jgi:hypothetical protein
VRHEPSLDTSDSTAVLAACRIVHAVTYQGTVIEAAKPVVRPRAASQRVQVALRSDDSGV